MPNTSEFIPTIDLLRYNFNSQEIQIILNTIKNLPPISWLLNKCRTERQKKHWREQKDIHTQLLHELQSYFAGNVPYLQTLGEDGLMEQDLIEILQGLAIRWLRFYDFTYLGWFAIKKGALILADTKEFDRLNTEAILTILEVNSPGELLAALIENECEQNFLTCQTYTEIRPRELHDFYLLQKKINSWRELSERPSITKGQEAKIKRFIQKSDQLNKDSKSLALKNLCLAICEAAVTNGKPQTLVTALKNYRSAESDLFNSFGSALHPRNGIKGSTWNNGENEPTR